MSRKAPEAGEIRHRSEYQRDWASVIKPLRRDCFHAENLSIHGDAPKDFLRIKEYAPRRRSRRTKNWTGYIAKVGSKDYPNESITEQLLTRIGQAAGVTIADSKLRMVAGQVRFLSKYFLAPSGESLVHGIQIFKQHLGDDQFVEEISVRKAERDFYTFQTVRSAMRDSFADQWPELMTEFVKMVGFDALVGNNDRHPLNWGVIVPVQARLSPRFAAIFDTARGLFWNVSELRVGRMLKDRQSLDAYVIGVTQ